MPEFRSSTTFNGVNETRRVAGPDCSPASSLATFKRTLYYCQSFFIRKQKLTKVACPSVPNSIVSASSVASNCTSPASNWANEKRRKRIPSRSSKSKPGPISSKCSQTRSAAVFVSNTRRCCSPNCSLYQIKIQDGWFQQFPKTVCRASYGCWVRLDQMPVEAHCRMVAEHPLPG